MQVIDKIANYEWDMLLATRSDQKHLECKNNKYMFLLMRRSQWNVYPLHIQASYLRDIHKAIAERRNLMIEKYGYMMEDTDSLVYERIKGELPAKSPEKVALVQDLMAYHRAWYDEAKEIVPKTVTFGRSISADGSRDTAIDTYLKGEFYTYSIDTLTRLVAYAKDMKEAQVNLIVETYKQYVALQ
ncbi:DUF4125 family protein [uncultured Veillonella sp.]|uniref:DUF4125 family protein n=1 Tax=uncultured Veillonella sp. TaxID=159268 RepID=UPI00262C612B|nr:DUF4125 family protein [uncultured Veillonella sp.]